jgi:CheY-like chemotaxis protein
MGRALESGDRSVPTVLVIDDDLDVVEVLVGALRRLGYRAAGARPNALPDARALSSAHVIVTDLVMPGTAALALMRHVRESGWPIAFVVVSAFADQKLRAQAKDLGAAAILHKPFFVDDLLAVIRRLAPVSI